MVTSNTRFPMFIFRNHPPRGASIVAVVTAWDPNRLLNLVLFFSSCLSCLLLFGTSSSAVKDLSRSS